jgi:hypothetical protein
VDVAAGTNFTRIMLLAATMRNLQNQFGEARSEGLYLENCNLPAPLTSRKRSRHQKNNRRSLIVDDAIFIDAEAKKKDGSQKLS